MATFTDEQRRNAKIIAEVGRGLGASARDIQIALMTALVESNLVNVNYGDRDSIGLFQQRDPWGTTAQRMDPYASAKMFFTGGHTGQRGLFDFKNRDQMGMGQAAQAVQVSAFPDRYAQRASDAASLLGGSGSANDGGAPATPRPQVSLGPGEENPAGTVTVNPTVDTTAGALADAARAAAPVPVVPLTSAPVGRSTDPTAMGSPVGRITDPTSATVDPSAQRVSPLAADAAPPEPAAPVTMTLDQFREMYPDAAQTRMFTDPGGSNARRSDLISTAMTYVGTPYVWGGVDRSGVDCSGLIQAVYKNFGVDLPRISADQARFGARVSMKDLRPGDLVGWDVSDRNNGVDHIAIYAGDGYIIESPRPGLNVRRRKLGGNYDADAFGVRISALG